MSDSRILVVPIEDESTAKHVIRSLNDIHYFSETGFQHAMDSMKNDIFPTLYYFKFPSKNKACTAGPWQGFEALSWLKEVDMNFQNEKGETIAALMHF